MISTTTPSRLPESAPAAVHELRAAFDARMMDLWHEATIKEPAAPTDGLERTAHVHFSHGALEVTAVFNCMSEQFTQLIARDASESGRERPSFTISVFL